MVLYIIFIFCILRDSLLFGWMFVVSRYKFKVFFTCFFVVRFLVREISCLNWFFVFSLFFVIFLGRDDFIDCFFFAFFVFNDDISIISNYMWVCNFVIYSSYNLIDIILIIDLLIFLFVYLFCFKYFCIKYV